MHKCTTPPIKVQLRELRQEAGRRDHDGAGPPAAGAVAAAGAIRVRLQDHGEEEDQGARDAAADAPHGAAPGVSQLLLLFLFCFVLFCEPRLYFGMLRYQGRRWRFRNFLARDGRVWVGGPFGGFGVLYLGTICFCFKRVFLSVVPPLPVSEEVL